MQNFGKIKNIFNNLLVEAIATKDKNKKKLFKKYVKAIKENAILKAQFLVYNNIESKVELNETKASEFVRVNIESLKKYSKKEIIEANESLMKHLISESKLPEYTNDMSQLHEDITTLIFTETNPKNVDSIVNALSGVVDYIKENEIKEDAKVISSLPNSVLTNIAVDKFNERYSELTEDEKKVFKAIIEADDKGKVEIFKNISRDCIDLVDKHLVESELETKEKLLQTKDRLLRLEYSNDSFITDISKLIELKLDLR